MNRLRLSHALAASVCLLAAPFSVRAQGAPPLSSDPASVKAGAYTLESRHARILWRVNHMGLSEWFGDFSGATGSGRFDPANPSANAVEVTIPTASVTTTNTTLDGELKSPDWFDASAFPTISFKSTSVNYSGKATADVAGLLTLHGVTKPVVLKVVFRAAGPNAMSRRYSVGFDATTSIKRSDFGVAKYVPLVGDDVEIIISAPFEKQD